jgi:hypothetical protein
MSYRFPLQTGSRYFLVRRVFLTGTGIHFARKRHGFVSPCLNFLHSWPLPRPATRPNTLPMVMPMPAAYLAEHVACHDLAGGEHVGGGLAVFISMRACLFTRVPR